MRKTPPLGGAFRFLARSLPALAVLTALTLLTALTGAILLLLLLTGLLLPAALLLLAGLLALLMLRLARTLIGILLVVHFGLSTVSAKTSLRRSPARMPS